MISQNREPEELSGGNGTTNDDSGSPTLAFEDLQDRQERREFRKKIFGWAKNLGIFFIVCWFISGVITTLGMLSFNLTWEHFSLENIPSKSAKYLLIEFGIISSVLLAVFMAIINLAKDKNQKEDDKPLLIEVGNHAKDILLALIRARTGHH